MAEYRYPYSAFSAGVLTPKELKAEIKKLITGHPDEAEEALLQLQFLFRDTDLPETDYIAIRNLCETELAKSAFNLHSSSSPRHGRDHIDHGMGLDFRSITLDGEFSDTAINKVLQEHDHEYQQELDRIHSADRPSDDKKRGKKDQGSGDATLVKLFPDDDSPDKTVIQGAPPKDVGESTMPFMRPIDSEQTGNNPQQAASDQDEGDATRIMPSKPGHTKPRLRNESEQDTLARSASGVEESEVETLFRSSSEVARDRSEAATHIGRSTGKHAGRSSPNNARRSDSTSSQSKDRRQSNVWLDLLQNQRFVLNAVIGICGLTIILLLVMDEPDLVDPSKPPVTTKTNQSEPQTTSDGLPPGSSPSSISDQSSSSMGVDKQPSTISPADFSTESQPPVDAIKEEGDLSPGSIEQSTTSVATHSSESLNRPPIDNGSRTSTAKNNTPSTRLAMTDSNHSRPPAYTTKDIGDLRHFLAEAIADNDLEPESEATSALAYLAQMKAFHSDENALREARADVAQAYLNLAKEARLLNRWNEAEEYVEKAIAVRIDR